MLKEDWLQGERAAILDQSEGQTHSPWPIDEFKELTADEQETFWKTAEAGQDNLKQHVEQHVMKKHAEEAVTPWARIICFICGGPGPTVYTCMACASRCCVRCLSGPGRLCERCQFGYDAAGGVGQGRGVLRQAPSRALSKETLTWETPPLSPPCLSSCP